MLASLMIRISEIKFPLDARFSAPTPESDPPVVIEAVWARAAEVLGVPLASLTTRTVFKRSFDARKKPLQVVYILEVGLSDSAQEAECLQRLAGNPHVQATPDMTWHPPVQAPADWAATHPNRPVVVGFGPCGLFAALVLAQMGLAPIVLERGPSVRQRTQDTWGLWRKRQLKPESNVQFGEGGAGTFSDGKLYSQIKDPRHLGRKVMQEFVRFGAPDDILYAAHPHIGTFKLVKVVEGLREEIRRLGGEVRFGHRVTDIVYDERRQLQGLSVLNQDTGESYTLNTQHAVMALGHSSRDTFVMLHRQSVAMQAKPFSIGVRIEHPQSLIDQARWGVHAGHPLLGAADYKLVHHARNGRTVYSFCMCPGGTVVAATSEMGRVVTNGMSQYSRAERNANSGLVVGIDPADYPQDPERLAAALAGWSGDTHNAATGAHPLSGIVLQRELEAQAYVLGGGTYEAPGQLVGDFLAQRASTTWGNVTPSYRPGVKLVDLHEALPAYATDAMREALPAMGRQIKGYDRWDAVMTGVETRTSSPLRIERNPSSLESPNLKGLYPAGEGAGYAGGILSAGVDGIKVGEAVARSLLGLPATN